MYVTEGLGPYAAPGPALYSPMPTTAYIAGGSYQPPPTVMGPASYTPAEQQGMSMQVVGATTTYPLVMQQQQQQQQPLQTQASTGSYVSAPGQPPPKLTEGMPDPGSVESQKQAYSKSIEAQLRQETGQLAQRNQAQKQALAQMVQQQKAQYNLQMDQYLQQQAMAVDQQANAEMMMLQEAAMAQKMALEQQAAGLTLEYQQRKAQEEMMAREYQIQRQYFDAEQKLAAQYQKQHGIEGRLSQQQLAMGHAALQGGPPPGSPMQLPPGSPMPMAGPQGSSMQIVGPPMTTAVGPQMILQGSQQVLGSQRMMGAMTPTRESRPALAGPQFSYSPQPGAQPMF